MAKDLRIGVWITGGGTMGGRAALGMIQYLEEIGLYPNKIKVFGGVSLGALSLMGVARNMSSEEMINYSLSLNSAFEFTPNKKTKVGASDINYSVETLRRDLFKGTNPKMDDSNIPIVFGGTNIETGEVKYFYGDYPLLEAFRQSIGNPFIFPVQRHAHMVIADGGLGCPVGVDFLRQHYKLDKVILFDIQTAHHYKFRDNMTKPLSLPSKLIISASESLTLIPFIGKRLKNIYFPWIVSSLVHLPATIRLLSRSSHILLNRIIEEEVKNQKPDVIVKLEDAVGTMEDLRQQAYLKENGLKQINYGYEAAKLKNSELSALK